MGAVTASDDSVSPLHEHGSDCDCNHPAIVGSQIG